MILAPRKYKVKYKGKRSMVSTTHSSSDSEEKKMHIQIENSKTNVAKGCTRTRLYIKWITNKDLLCSTANSTQYSVTTYMGKNLKRDEYMYVYK